MQTLSERDADLLEMLLDGTLPLGPRYLTRPEREAVAADATLPDGVPWALPLALRVAQAPDEPRLVLADPESVPMAVLHVREVRPEEGAVVLAGDLTPLRARSSRPFERLRATATTPRTAEVVTVPTSRPLVEADLAAVAALAGTHSAVTLVGLVGHGRPTPRAALARALLAAGDELVRRSPGLDLQVRLLPLPTLGELDPQRSAALLGDVAAATGATRVMLPAGEVSRLERPPARSPVDLVVGPLPVPSLPEVRDILAGGGQLPSGYAPPRVERELRRLHPPATEQGLVLLFTGLSGSGKSTVAAAVVDALAEEGSRTVTVLDGDVVRTMLSAGLTFSRADRDLNVLRIGYVAAEVARHGGTAVCAPIAPYAATRARVRSMVGAAGGVLVLVHVSTPLAVCEARDRKGLYAKARAGLIPEFTGVSDPYEVPRDADLTLDTSVLSTQVCVDAVMDLLAGRGLVRR